ncbi:MAG: glucose-6-phosphate isomerase, partial [Bacteroidota bacterium]
MNTTHPTQSAAWEKLQAHFQDMKDVHMKDLFAQDPARFQRFSLQFEDILLDYSKNRITADTLQALQELAEAQDLKDAIEKMFSGDKINATEDRAVLH